MSDNYCLQQRVVWTELCRIWVVPSRLALQWCRVLAFPIMTTTDPKGAVLEKIHALRYIPEDYAVLLQHSVPPFLLRPWLGRPPPRPPSVVFHNISSAAFGSPVTIILVSCALAAFAFFLRHAFRFMSFFLRPPLCSSSSSGFVCAGPILPDLLRVWFTVSSCFSLLSPIGLYSPSFQ